jgi:hypothetical protein
MSTDDMVPCRIQQLRVNSSDPWHFTQLSNHLVKAIVRQHGQSPCTHASKHLRLNLNRVHTQAMPS